MRRGGSRPILRSCWDHFRIGRHISIVEMIPVGPRRCGAAGRREQDSEHRSIVKYALDAYLHASADAVFIASSLILRRGKRLAEFPIIAVRSYDDLITAIVAVKNFLQQ
jgi:hypothetical protein